MKEVKQEKKVHHIHNSHSRDREFTEQVSLIHTYRQVLEYIPEACLVFNNSPQEVFANELFLELFKYDNLKQLQQECITGFEILERNVSGIEPHHLHHVLDNSQTLNLEIVANQNNPDHFMGDCHISPLSGTDKEKTTGFFIHIRDIAPKTSSENNSLSHHELDHAFMDVIDLLPIPMFYKNTRGEFMMVNKAYEALTHLSKNEVIGKTIFEVLPANLAQLFHNENAIMYQKGHEHKFDAEIPYSDGSTHNVIVTIAPLHDDQKHILGCIGTLLDVTQIKSIRSSLRYRYHFEKLLLDISSDFINIPTTDVDTMVEKSLQRIVSFIDVDEGFVMQYSHINKTVSMSHLFRQDGDHDMKHQLSNLPIEQAPYLKQMLEENDIVMIDDIDELPEAAVKEKRMFKANQVKSVIVVPFVVEDRIIGNLGFSSVKRYRKWTHDEAMLLRLTGKVLASALERKKNINAILYREEILRTITLQMNSFLANNNWKQNMAAFLSALGKQLSVSRMFLVRLHVKKTEAYGELIHEWCNTHISPCLTDHEWERWNLYNTPVKVLIHELNKNGVVKNHVDELTGELRSFYLQYAIKTSLLIPVFVKGKLWGVLGLTEEVKMKREWLDAEIDPLVIMTRFIGLSIERGKANEALKEEEEKFRKIFEKSNDALVISDFSGNVHIGNPNFWAEQYFRDQKQNRKYNIFKLFDKESRERFKLGLSQLQENNKLPVAEYNIKKPTGEKRTLGISNAMIDFKNQKAFLSVIRDITERKEMNKKLLETTIQTEEKERQRIAEDLHDELGPLLSGIKLYISELGERGNSEHQKQLTTYLEEMVDAAVKETRRLSNNLMPNVLIDYGLEKGLEAFINKINLVYPTNILLQYAGNKKSLQPVQEIVIYRIIIELINNSVKHANAREIIIELAYQKNMIKITYQDNGIGFDLNDELVNRTGIGLSSLLNRLATVQGTYQFSSQHNKGIQFIITIPT